MGCRIGMTTNLEVRKAYWGTIYKNLRKWQKLGGPYSKTEAQAKETQLAKKYGCESHHGGEGKENDKWYVYYFKHDGKK